MATAAVRRSTSSTTTTAHDKQFTMATMALAAVALVLAVLQLWEVGAAVALVAVLVGGWAQLVSETRTERFQNIFAITLSAVVIMVCLASGGVFTS